MPRLGTDISIVQRCTGQYTSHVDALTIQALEALESQLAQWQDFCVSVGDQVDAFPALLDQVLSSCNLMFLGFCDKTIQKLSGPLLTYKNATLRIISCLVPLAYLKTRWGVFYFFWGPIRRKGTFFWLHSLYFPHNTIHFRLGEGPTPGVRNTSVLVKCLITRNKTCAKKVGLKSVGCIVNSILVCV